MTLSPNNLPVIPPWRRKYDAPAQLSLCEDKSALDNRLSLKSYAERCFSACSTEKEKDIMESALKEKLSRLNQRDLASMDWVKEPIPFLSASTKDIEPLKKKTCFPNSSLPQVKVDISSVKGTCSALEKAYFRLTSEADPSTVRPEPILKQSFAFVLDKWEKEQNVPYIIEQLKSIRQDISIQSIKNDFAIQVYETNCKIALVSNQFDELVQCLGQLMALYKTFPEETKDEFICYHMLYMLFAQNYAEYNILIRRNNLKSKTLNFCKFVSRAIYERNSFGIIQAHQSCPYSASLILKNIYLKFFADNLPILNKAFKSTSEERYFASLFEMESS